MCSVCQAASRPNVVWVLLIPTPTPTQLGAFHLLSPGCQDAFLPESRGEAWPAAGPSPTSSLSTAESRKEPVPRRSEGSFVGIGPQNWFGVRWVMVGCFFPVCTCGNLRKEFQLAEAFPTSHHNTGSLPAVPAILVLRNPPS